MTDTDIGDRGDSAPEEMPEGLIDAIRRGECVIFLGSAVNAHPDGEYAEKYSYPEDQRPPIGSQLSELVAEKFHFTDEMGDESTADLMRVSMFAETKGPFGRKRLVDYLDKVLRGTDAAPKRPSDAVRMLAALPFQVFVTTNYDLLLDQALQDEGKDPYTLVYNPTESQTTDIPDDQELSSDQPLVFKMHGDLDNRPSIVITDEDYITFVNRMAERPSTHPVPDTVRTAMQLWPTIFLGYSLRDYNLRLFFRMIRAHLDPSQIQEAFAVDKYPDELIRHVWEYDRKLVAFLIEDIWGWVPDVYELVHGHPYQGPSQR